MKIGLFTECYLPTVNGVVYCVENIRKTLRNIGHNVTTFVPHNQGDKYKYDNDIYPINSIKLGKTGYYFTYGFGKDLQKNASGCDILHTHHPFALARDALKISKKYNIPLIFTHHTQYYQYLPYVPKFFRGFAKKILHSFLKKFCDSCDVIIAPSSGIKRTIADYGTKTKVEVIHNGIELKKFQSSNFSIPEEFKKINKDYDVILFTGRIAYEKNISFLLSAFAKALETNHKIYLMIVGDGPALDSLKAESEKLQIGKNVIFTGNIPREKIQNYYRAADIFSSASKTEVHPLVGLEAQASGLPVVSLISVGYEDIIQDGENGYFAKESVDDFAEKLNLILSDKDRLKHMSDIAIERSKESSIEKSVEKILSLYNELIKSRKKEPNQLS